VSSSFSVMHVVPLPDKKDADTAAGADKAGGEDKADKAGGSAPGAAPAAVKPPGRQPSGGKSMVSVVNFHTHATRIGWLLWEID